MSWSYLTIEVEAERRQEVLARSEPPVRREPLAEAPEDQSCVHEPAVRPRRLATETARQASPG